VVSLVGGCAEKNDDKEVAAAAQAAGPPFYCFDTLCHISKDSCVEDSIGGSLMAPHSTQTKCVEAQEAWCFEKVLRPIKPDHAQKTCLSSQKICNENLSDDDPMGRTCVQIGAKDYNTFLTPGPVPDKPGPEANGDVRFCGAVFPADTTKLACAGDVKDITALKHLKNLEDLRLSIFCDVEDLSPLASLTKLKTLDFEGNLVYDLKPLANLSSLAVLRFSGNLADDLSPLSDLKNLELLILPDTATDLSPLAGLTNLQMLDAGRGVTDLSPLAGLTALTSLRVTNAKDIVDFSPLGKLKALTKLDLTGSNFADTTVLSGLDKLERLELAGTDIVDSSPLASLPNLRMVELSNSKTTDVSALVKRLKGGVHYSGTPAQEKRPSQ
jgi:hypothetical protein